MDGKLRQLKIIELKAKVVLYELEQAALLRELRTTSTSNERRAEIYRRRPRLKFEHTEAVNDLAWFSAEERLLRSVKVAQMGVLVQWEQGQRKRSGVWTNLVKDKSQS